MNKKISSASWVATIVLIICGIASGCASTSAQKSGSPDDPLKFASNANLRPTALSRAAAWLRAHQLGKLNYTLWFGLEDQADTYEGRVVVNFELKDLKKALLGNGAKEIQKEIPKEIKDLSDIIALDFEGGEIHSLSLNGVSQNLLEASPLVKKRYDGHRIYFHISELLAAGANRIEVSFSQHFSTDGFGFNRFIDPEDKQSYFYTDSEPYGAHRIFPCFDQPDLKASYELTVETPKDWEVIANTPERDVSTVDGRRSWAFPPSPVFSTYLFELAAGPYASWKESADGIPLRIFSRKSQKDFVDPKEWFDTTKRGLEYFTSYFGYTFPYAKLDQLIVPEMIGAMENVAAITFGESMALHRSKPTSKQKRRNQNTILHEMAHMWFGDLVTMRWWNGLWLNESFATYMSFKAQAELEGPNSNIWETFYDDIKNSAEIADQLTTTHPVEPQVLDTDEAKTSFDDITYDKGASILKQLNYFLGEENFHEGLQRYFQKYALRNTTTTDFMRMLGEASEKDLSKWQKLWLQSSGLNGLGTNWTCDDQDKINKFVLTQTAASEGDRDLRPHKTQIAIYKLSPRGKAELRLRDVVTANYSGAETTVDALIGKACPEFVFPNHEDFDYSKIELDPISLKFARVHINQFESAFMRKFLWNHFWSLVVDGKMKSTEMMDLFLTEGVTEKEPEVLDSLFSKILGFARGAKNQPSLLKYIPESIRAEPMNQLDQIALKMLKSSPGGSDLQRVWWNAWIRIATNEESLDFADKLFSGKAKLRGFQLGQPERWSLVQLMARNATTPEKQVTVNSLIVAESKIDRSDDAIHAAIAAQVLIPDAENKKKWLGYLLAPIQEPLTTSAPVTDTGIKLNPIRLRTAAANYLSTFSPTLALTAENVYFRAIPKMAQLSENPYAATFTSSLFPSFCDPRIVEETTKVISESPGLPPEVVKRLKLAKQEEQRCIRAQRMFNSTGQ